METFSALLAIWAGNSPVPGEFPAQRPVTRSFDVFFDLRLNKRLSKQSWDWWFETLSCPLWRHWNEVELFLLLIHPYYRKINSYPKLKVTLGTSSLLTLTDAFSYQISSYFQYPNKADNVIFVNLSWLLVTFEIALNFGTVHWNGNAVSLTKFSSLAVVVSMTTSSATSDKNFIKTMIFTFQRWSPVYPANIMRHIKVIITKLHHFYKHDCDCNWLSI